MSKVHVVFGTGAVGTAVIHELVSKGRMVRAANRSGVAHVPFGVAVVRADAASPAEAVRICEGASVVYHCANPGYVHYDLFPSIQAGIIAGAAAAGAKLVVAENLYMYGEVDGPLTEALPYTATTRKGRIRARLSEALMEAHHSGRLKVAIGRASDFYGPGVLESFVGERVFYPALAGKRVSMFGDLDAPHTYTYIGDFARGLVKLGEHEEAFGQAWHVPSAETLTTRQFLSFVFEEAGHRPNIGTAPAILPRILGPFVPIIREIAEMLYEFEEPFVVDHRKFESAFGADVTPHREAIQNTLAWYRQHPTK
jgi:nucleoside-diphosphate-sugar epimerase